ncbi:MAG TPA: alkaline phosphatase [Bryobacteraceae bacterium]|nr:alkaline phosphatase [Bryobacteraceae bacterium]
MTRLSALLLVSILPLAAGERRARNVILFLGDAGGIPTLNAASIVAHQKPQQLFVQHMPHIALSDTSSASAWVTDSAAGMTAIVTGEKTDNGVLSMSAAAKTGGERRTLKTILEYAEEHGLATGLISNSSMADATPAACYSHVDDRSKTGEIFAQVLKPRYGDGVDLIIGPGRKEIFEATGALGMDLAAELAKKGYGVYDAPEKIGPDTRRAIVLFEDGEYDVKAAVRRAVSILSRNSKGYFLMVEWDMHTDDIRRGIRHAIEMDGVVRETAGAVGSDTLVLFTADHSFDFRVRGGMKDQPLLPEAPDAPLVNVRMDNGHTGEEVLAAAQGPGSERIRGFLANADLFQIMLAAWGWK